MNVDLRCKLVNNNPPRARALGNLLRMARAGKNLGLRQLVKAIGRSPNLVGRQDTGDRLPQTVSQPSGWHAQPATHWHPVRIQTNIMTMETLPITDVKARLAELVVQVEKQRDRVTITRNGKPAAILVSVGEWDSINETLDVLSDPEALKDIREADEAYARGDVYSNADIEAILRARMDGTGHVA